jgi:hypothetical protein
MSTKHMTTCDWCDRAIDTDKSESWLHIEIGMLAAAEQDFCDVTCMLRHYSPETRGESAYRKAAGR